MSRFLRAPIQPVTYARWLHLVVPSLCFAVWMFIAPQYPWVPALFIAPCGLVPWVRLAEGLQAQFLLVAQGETAEEKASISAAPSRSWADRWRTVLWLEIRVGLAGLTLFASVWLLVLTVELVGIAVGRPPGDDRVVPEGVPAWAAALLSPLPLLVLIAVVTLLGEAVTGIARRLLGPSAAERLSRLEVRTAQLLERARIARELHDSIGHALTVAVVQAGAARAAGNPDFTERALGAIEETGRAALEDLERVLKVLRESGQPPSAGPTLGEADRLLESARGSGSAVDVRLSGRLDRLPDPVSREGYRILQEALTNVLRHCGPVPVRVRIDVSPEGLELEVVNPCPEDRPMWLKGGGGGLRGIRERAALLGGEAHTGPHAGEWRVSARLPLERIP
ncbi:histidine kinase [Streptomyces bambusae]|uniref:sensor histidine kinase n=1 Tax=Streptomyces bambusae TaxID=1550616 RepID=UPI001CFF5FAD|nr:histidine kinase [Streptomyces bambusae]MCB5169394.1 histidine kinase [Streptomyces bambusae]